MKNDHLHELLYQALETELSGVQVYTTALRCVENKDLKEEWQEYLEQTHKHVQIVTDLMDAFGLDPEKETPGRKVVRHSGESLVKAMEMALKSGEAGAAQLVAAESVVLAETKDHLNWQLIGETAKKAKGEEAKALKAAHEEVEELIESRGASYRLGAFRRQREQRMLREAAEYAEAREHGARGRYARRQRVRVELELVGARLGYSERPGASRVGDGLRDELAVLAGGDARAGDGLAGSRQRP